MLYMILYPRFMSGKMRARRFQAPQFMCVFSRTSRFQPTPSSVYCCFFFFTRFYYNYYNVLAAHVFFAM